MKVERDFKNLYEGYQSRIITEYINYLIDKNGGDMCRPFDKLFFTPQKKMEKL
jgi:hypothetical protein